MTRSRRRFDPKQQAQLRAQVQRDQAAREKTYRERALALFPHVCGRCGREFAGPRLRELTVHHIDGDHMNNPPDGSNWELLCLYCHDDAHGAYERTAGNRSSTAWDDGASAEYSPFEGLKGLFAPEERDKKPETGG